jgi:hypothetical protein
MADSIPIYRFLNADGALKTLIDGRFRVGQLSQFNDPFEWRLGFTGITTPEEQWVADKIQSEHRPWVESWMGVLCFTGDASNLALWSLYADNHKGAAFEVKYPWKPDGIVKMAYSKDRPVLDFNELRKLGNDNERDEYLKSVICRLSNQKPVGFSFEQEHRLQIDLQDTVHCRLLNGHYYWKPPDGSFKRVVLGFQSPLEETTVRKLLNMNGYADTDVVRAKLCQEAYSVII